MTLLDSFQLFFFNLFRICFTVGSVVIKKLNDFGAALQFHFNFHEAFDITQFILDLLKNLK